MTVHGSDDGPGQVDDASAVPGPDGVDQPVPEEPMRDPGARAALPPRRTPGPRDPAKPSAPTRRRRGHRQPLKPRNTSKVGGAVRETVIVVVTALVLSLLVKTFLLQAFFIPSESMEATLVEGDRVVVSKLTPGPFDISRGDVVVFEDPGGWLPPPLPDERGPLAKGVGGVLSFVGLLPPAEGNHLIKRVIGTAGDRVECCDAQGRLIVNGESIDEVYLYPGDDPSTVDFDITVPAGSVWVMGDHRSASEDSRFHQGDAGGGSVPVSRVVGRGIALVWPLNRFTRLSTEGDVFDQVPDAP